jgi:hypothetical protein
MITKLSAPIFVGILLLYSAVVHSGYSYEIETGAVKKLMTCDHDSDSGQILIWLETEDDVIVYRVGAATADSDESQVRKNFYSTALAAYVGGFQLSVMGRSGSSSGVKCGVSYSKIVAGVSIGSI